MSKWYKGKTRVEQMLYPIIGGGVQHVDIFLTDYFEVCDNDQTHKYGSVNDDVVVLANERIEPETLLCVGFRKYRTGQVKLRYSHRLGGWNHAFDYRTRSLNRVVPCIYNSATFQANDPIFVGA